MSERDIRGLEERLLLKTRPIGQSLGGVTMEHDPDCVQAASALAALRSKVEELDLVAKKLADGFHNMEARALAAEAKVERLTEALKAIVDQLDDEEMGEAGLSAKDWIAHWQRLHDDAARALSEVKP